MAEVNDGGQAFPAPQSMFAGGSKDGMSLRDWFAGQAVAGHDLDGNWCTPNYAELAMHCYQIADAMLAARSATNEKGGKR